MGFIKFIILLIITIIILSVFNINLKNLFQNSLLQENFGFIFQKAKAVWSGYFEKPLKFIQLQFIKFIKNPGVFKKKGAGRENNNVVKCILCDIIKTLKSRSFSLLCHSSV